MRRVYLLAAVIALAGSLAAQDKKKDPDQIGNRDVGKGVNFYSIQKEIALGKAMAQQVMQNARVIDDPVISEYVNRVAQNLARNSDTKLPLTTHVIHGDDINALSLPGGYFFVNTGLILAADTEAELAGAMAHEIAHIAARHGTRQARRQELANMATIPLIFVGGWAGYGVRQAAGVAVPVTFLYFSRGFENEADLYGLQYLYKAGYDPVGMVDIFEKIEALNKRKPGKMSKYFSTHPPTGERIIAIQKDIQELLKERPEYVVNTSEFNVVKARLLELENRRKNEPEDQDRPRLRTVPKPRLSLAYR
jgi:beta-barrel assembly-enhancing protease